MELTLDLKKQYSYADYMTWWDDKRRELINGFIHMVPPSVSLRHASLVVNIGYKLCNYIDTHKLKYEAFFTPLDVRLPKNGETEDENIYSVVQPDIFMVCDLSKLEERGCLGAPDLVVEILSPSNRKYDLSDKYLLYEASGVKEYWVVAPLGNDITVFLLQENGTYAEGILYREKVKVPVHTLPGLEIDLEELFRNIH